MTQLWPVKVFRKIQVQKQLENSNLEPNRLGGKIPAQAPGRLGCRLGSRHAQGAGRLPSRHGCRPGWSDHFGLGAPAWPYALF